jgi:hypothetical protein
MIVKAKNQRPVPLPGRMQRFQDLEDLGVEKHVMVCIKVDVLLHGICTVQMPSHASMCSRFGMFG